MRGTPRVVNASHSLDSSARCGVLRGTALATINSGEPPGAPRQKRRAKMVAIATNQGTATPTLASDADRWAAVLRRDPSADGRFYYAVTTTGVYCRPSCASRTARRENVQFYSTREEAERAGFRPCRRCRPNGPGL